MQRDFHQASRAQLRHPRNMEPAAQRGVAACVSEHEACGCAHSGTSSTRCDRVPRYMQMHVWQAQLHAGQLLRRMMPERCRGTAGARPTTPQVRALALAEFVCWCTARLYCSRQCSAFAGDSMNVPLAPGLRYTIEVARRTGISMPACGGSPPLPGPSAGSAPGRYLQEGSGATQLPGSDGTAMEASSGCQRLQDPPVCPPMPQPAVGPLVAAAPLAPARSETAQPLPDPDRLARMQPPTPPPTAAVASTDPAAGVQGATGEPRAAPSTSATHPVRSLGQQMGMQFPSCTLFGAADAGAVWGLGVQESACADLAGCVAGLQQYIAQLNSSHLSDLRDGGACHPQLESMAGLPRLHSSCRDASGEPAGSSAAAFPHHRNYESTRVGDASSDAEDIRCKGTLRCASSAGTTYEGNLRVTLLQKHPALQSDREMWAHMERNHRRYDSEQDEHRDYMSPDVSKKITVAALAAAASANNAVRSALQAMSAGSPLRASRQMRLEAACMLD